MLPRPYENKCIVVQIRLQRPALVSLSAVPSHFLARLWVVQQGERPRFHKRELGPISEQALS
jgi:hypothetical protein